MSLTPCEKRQTHINSSRNEKPPGFVDRPLMGCKLRSKINLGALFRTSCITKKKNNVMQRANGLQWQTPTQIDANSIKLSANRATCLSCLFLGRHGKTAGPKEHHPSMLLAVVSGVFRRLPKAYHKIPASSTWIALTGPQLLDILDLILDI